MKKVVSFALILVLVCSFGGSALAESSNSISEGTFSQFKIRNGIEFYMTKEQVVSIEKDNGNECEDWFSIDHDSAIYVSDIPLGDKDGYCISYSFNDNNQLVNISYWYSFDEAFLYPDSNKIETYTVNEIEKIVNNIDYFSTAYEALKLKYGEPNEDTQKTNKIDVKWKVEYEDSPYYVDIHQYIYIDSKGYFHSHSIDYTVGDTTKDIENYLDEEREKQEKIDKAKDDV